MNYEELVASDILNNDNSPWILVILLAREGCATEFIAWLWSFITPNLIALAKYLPNTVRKKKI